MAFSVTNNFSSGVNTSFYTELNENNTDIENEFNGVSPTPNTLTHIAPIGSVVAWLKSLTNTPSLPDGWVECNGQTISDAESVYDGVTIPDLNASAGTARFLRGATTSGSTGGSETHKHQWFDYTGSDSGGFALEHSYRNHTWNSAGSLIEVDDSNVDFYTSTVSALPSYYSVVWIMRIK